MTENSKICQILKTIRESIDSPCTNAYVIEKFKELYPDIKIKRDGDLAIFNYDIGADFTNPVIQEARGIIIDLYRFDVVCWAFRKFGKYDELYADSIDWSSAIVQEKIDGSIIKLWYNDIMDRWMWSTNSTIYAEDANYNQETGETFMDIIMKTDEYDSILQSIDGITIDNCDGNVLVGNITYIFELTSPDNKVVIPYDRYRMRLIGARNNRTGVEYRASIKGVDNPSTYDLHSLKDCIEYCSKMNLNNDGVVDKIHGEGFVVVDKYFNRIKIKSPEYMMMHGMVSGDKKSRVCLIDLLYHDKLNITAMCHEFPEMAHILCYYKYQMEELLYETYSMIDVARRLNNILPSRKDVALRIKDKRTSMFGFAAINNPNMNAKEIINDFFNRGKIINLIPEYDGASFRDCFQDLP